MSGSAISPARPLDEALARAALNEMAIAPKGPWADALGAGAANAPYLRRLALRRADTARRLAAEGPDGIVVDALAAADAAANQSFAVAMRALRQAKADIHLACAVGDLAGAWGLARVTGVLSDLAERAVRSALVVAARDLTERGDLAAVLSGARGPVPGFIVLAMGKLGARELNYSSDIDLIAVLRSRRDRRGRCAARRAGAALRLVRAARARSRGGHRRMVTCSAPICGCAPIRPRRRSPCHCPAAEHYYQSVGQNWERAAFIKARPVAGDSAGGEIPALDLRPSSGAATSISPPSPTSIRSSAKSCRAQGRGELDDAGPDVKLGRGGIREIELFAQTQQLILGGRDPSCAPQRRLARSTR